MSLRNSLNRHLDWTELLDFLGHPPETRTLPAVSRCPGCSGKLEIYQDAGELGQWYRCRDCHFLGDGLELAMYALNLSLDDTVSALLRIRFSFDYGESVPEMLADYEENRIKRRQKARNFWTEAKAAARLKNIPGAVALQRRFSRDLDWTEEEWKQHGGQFFGATTKYLAEACWQPGNIAYRQAGGDGSKHKSGGGVHRMFIGPDWDGLLVIPYYDLPGRINGFLYMGRELRPQIDWTYHAVIRLATQALHTADVGTGRMEAGAAFLHVAEYGPHPRFGDRLFVLDDPGLALRMHMLHIAEHTRPLPLLASWDSAVYRTMGMWDHLPTRPRLFVGQTFTPNMILQARRTGAPLALLPPGVEKKFDELAPEALLTYLENNAVDWERAVEHQLGTLPPPEAAEFFRKLQLPDLDVSRFLAAAAPPVRQRLDGLLRAATSVRILPLGQQKIEVTPLCWRYARTKEILTDAPFVLDQVLHRTNSGQTQYRGTISFRGEAYPFLAEASVFDADPFRWVRDFLIRNGAGMPLYKNQQSHNAMQLAQQIKTPEYVAVPDAIGWQTGAQAFVFPDFTIKANGQLLESGSGRPAAGYFPCRNFAPPRALSALELEALSKEDAQVRLFWAVAAVVVADALAPITHQPLLNVVVTGRATQLTVRYAAEALGCVILTPRTGRQHSGALRDAQKLLDLHTWPVMMTRPSNETSLSLPPSALGGLPQPSLATAEPLDAAICATDPRWVVIETHDHCPRPHVVPAGADAVMPAYLQDLARRRLQLNGSADPLFPNILQDLADWFERQGGNPQSVTAAESLFVVSADLSETERFANLLARALDSGACFIQSEGAPHKNNKPFLVRMRDGQIHIPAVTLRRVVTSRGVPAIDDQVVREALKAPEGEVEGEPGWLVSAEWLDRQLRRFRAPMRGYPRIAR